MIGRSARADEGVADTRGSTAAWALPMLLALSMLVIVAGCLTGSVAIGPRAVFQALLLALGKLPGPPDGPTLILLTLRLPRVLAGFATGGLLAVAGALMQILLGNPLAEPYVLGISGGAAVGALLAISSGLGLLGVKAGALAGAMLAMVLILWPMRNDRWRKRGPARRVSVAGASAIQANTLLLTGVVMAAGWGALVTLILTLAPEARLRGMLFWLMGDLEGVQAWQPAAVGLLVLLACTGRLAADLNILLRGSLAAFALGVPVARRQGQLHLLAAAATALAVTTAGTIGFVGLIIPHAARRLFGHDQRVVLPASALLGGCLVSAADSVARTLLQPVQLPVGVMMALLGVPAFLWLLRQERR